MHTNNSSPFRSKEINVPKLTLPKVESMDLGKGDSDDELHLVQNKKGVVEMIRKKDMPEMHHAGEKEKKNPLAKMEEEDSEEEMTVTEKGGL